MKRIFALFAGVGLAAMSHATPAHLDAQQVHAEITRSMAATMQLAAQLNWQVGDFHNNEIKMAFGNGTGTKTVSQDVPAEGAFWYVNEIAILGQKQKTEALMRRSDGKVLKLIVNGEEQDPNSDNSQIEIVEQRETSVQVPAGKFDCFYIKANIVQDGKKTEIEAWINPVDVNLDGMLKTVIQSQFGPITMTLNKFGHK